MKLPIAIPPALCLHLAVIAPAVGGALPNAIKITNQSGGWQILPGQRYRYGLIVVRCKLASIVSS